MVRVTAATSFLGDEGMWRAGDTKEVSTNRAHELIEAGLAIEASAATEKATARPEAPSKAPKRKPGEGRETKPVDTEPETK